MCTSCEGALHTVCQHTAVRQASKQAEKIGEHKPALTPTAPNPATERAGVTTNAGTATTAPVAARPGLLAAHPAACFVLSC